VKRLVKRAAALKLGDGLQSGITHGPLISANAVDRVDQKVSEALAGGATASLGGSRAEFQDSPLAGGFFYVPTVLTRVQPDMRIFSEEIFGPVTPVVQFETEEQAVQAANSTPYGLAGYFYTRDLGRAWRVSEALEYGMIGVNSVAITSEVAPFGGVKESGYGREQSKYGLVEFQNLKTVCVDISDS
jgi:succinate-semialdehyde dehydrogenase/glutarate-semialdehyde dehydrogenase